VTDKWAVVLIGTLFAIEWVQREQVNPLQIERFPQPLRWSCYYAIAIVIFLLAPLHSAPFIYFQF